MSRLTRARAADDARARQRAAREPDHGRRAPYRLEFQADPDKPISTSTPRRRPRAEAVRLANAAVDALREYLAERAPRATADARASSTRPARPRPRRRGQRARRRPQLVLLTFLVVFGVALALLFGIGASGAAGARPAAAGAAGDGRRRRPPRRRRMARRDAARAVRALAARRRLAAHRRACMPWMIAGFMVVLWMVPFNAIQLAVSLPIDLKFDRLVLPVLFAIWVLALAAGGPGAPRLRLTPIHVGIAGLHRGGVPRRASQRARPQPDARVRPRVQEAHAAALLRLFFLIVASSVRRSEVPAFLKFTLVLGVICALGDRSGSTASTTTSSTSCRDTLLPGFFTVGAIDAGEVDDIGRRMTLRPGRAPARDRRHAVDGAADRARRDRSTASERRGRILYGLAACILLAAAISTYRKSALLAPIAVVLTIAVLPPPRAAPARAARGASSLIVDPRPVARRARIDPVPAPAEPARRRHRERPRRGLRRRAPGRLDAPAVRPRLRQLRPRQLPDPRLGDPQPDRRHRRRSGLLALVLMLRGDRVRGARPDPRRAIPSGRRPR